MEHSGVLSVATAAQRLGITDARVRAMLRSGVLQGTKLTDHWLVSAQSVRERELAGAPPGRQLEPSNAWVALAFASGEPAPWASDEQAQRVARLLERSGLTGLRPRLRRRAQVVLYYAHPGVLPELSASSKLALAGISAAGANGLGIVAGAELDAYVAEREVHELATRFALARRDRGGNVTLRMLPPDLDVVADRPIPLAAVALDLAEGGEPRGAQLGAAKLQDLDAERRWERLDDQ